MPLEIIHGYTLNNAGAQARVTMFGEDSNVIRRYTEGKNCLLLGTWASTSGTYTSTVIRSPRMHDNVNGIQNFDGGQEKPVLFDMFNLQQMIAQDNLNIFITSDSGAGEYDQIALLIYYEDLPQAQGKYKSYNDIVGKTGQIMTLKHTLDPGTSLTDYDAGEVITTDQDEFDALKEYAFLGFKNQSAGEICSICLRGHDTGNLRIGQPDNNNFALDNSLFFLNLAFKTGLPVIPIINAANKDNTYIDLATYENGDAGTIISYWAEILS